MLDSVLAFFRDIPVWLASVFTQLSFVVGVVVALVYFVLDYGFEKRPPVKATLVILGIALVFAVYSSWRGLYTAPEPAATLLAVSGLPNHTIDAEGKSMVGVLVVGVLAIANRGPNSTFTGFTFHAKIHGRDAVSPAFGPQGEFCLQTRTGTTLFDRSDDINIRSANHLVEQGNTLNGVVYGFFPVSQNDLDLRTLSISFIDVNGKMYYSTTDPNADLFRQVPDVGKNIGMQKCPRGYQR